MGLFDWLFGRRSAVRCEACARAMELLDAPTRGGVILTGEEARAGVGGAEQCWECGRVYCDRCYPARPRNTCVCGRGRDAERHYGGTTYYGSMHLVKVRYRG